MIILKRIKKLQQSEIKTQLTCISERWFATINRRVTIAMTQWLVNLKGKRNEIVD